MQSDTTASARGSAGTGGGGGGATSCRSSGMATWWASIFFRFGSGVEAIRPMGDGAAAIAGAVSTATGDDREHADAMTDALRSSRTRRAKAATTEQRNRTVCSSISRVAGRPGELDGRRRCSAAALLYRAIERGRDEDDR